MIANFACSFLGCRSTLVSQTFGSNLFSDLLPHWKAEEWTMTEELFSVEKVQCHISFYDSQHLTGLGRACWFGNNSRANALHEGDNLRDPLILRRMEYSRFKMKSSELTKFLERGDVFAYRDKKLHVLHFPFTVQALACLAGMISLDRWFLWTISKAASLEGWWFHPRFRACEFSRGPREN